MISVKKKNIFRDLILPFLIWGGVILVFLNVKHLPWDLGDKDGIVLRYFVKVLMTILLPLFLIHLIYKDKSDFGIYFPSFKESFLLTFHSFSVIGPGFMTFFVIGWLGWSFGDWKGGGLLSLVFLVVFYLVPKAVASFPPKETITTPNNRIMYLVCVSLLTVVIAFYTYDYVPVVSKMLYYLFIVGFGEELFFRGYFQSAMNKVFSKKYYLGNVQFGWGLIISAAVFGLTHALVTVPPTWPWAVWTALFGLTLAFIREKDGSILAAIILHGIADFPLAFMSVN